MAAGGRDHEAGRRLWLNAEMFGYLGDALTDALGAWEQRKAELLAEHPRAAGPDASGG